MFCKQRALRTRTKVALIAAATLTSLIGAGISCGNLGHEVVQASLEDDLRGSGRLTPLLAFTGACTFSGSTATLALKSGDTAVVARRATDGAITVNDVACGAATNLNMKTLNINEDAPGPQTVVLDYLNGTFATGSAVAGQGIVINYGTDAADKLMLRMTSAIDKVRFGANGVNVNGDAFKDLIFTTTPKVFTVSLGGGNDEFSAGGDTATGAAFAQPVTVYGGDGNDSLRGGNGADFLYGDDGDDILDAEANAGGGADTFDGGAGNDTLTYAARSNPVTVTIGDGADDGETGENDTVAESIEIVTGGSGNDILSGSLVVTASKTLNGGPGNDTFLQRNAGGPDSHDTLNGGPGIDTVDYSARTVALTVTMDGLAANDGAASELDNVKADVENIKGGTGDDSITGNAGNNRIAGGAGNNSLNGGAGDDVFDQGDDAANVGQDTIDGGDGIDTVDYSARTHALVIVMDGTTASGDTANNEVDKIKLTVENAKGGTGNDSITGNALNNSLQGNAGDDTITALGGDDELDGGAGSDTLDCGAGSDIAIDGETVDPSCEIVL